MKSRWELFIYLVGYGITIGLALLVVLGVVWVVYCVAVGLFHTLMDWGRE